MVKRTRQTKPVSEPADRVYLLSKDRESLLDYGNYETRELAMITGNRGLDLFGLEVLKHIKGDMIRFRAAGAHERIPDARDPDYIPALLPYTDGVTGAVISLGRFRRCFVYFVLQGTDSGNRALIFLAARDAEGHGAAGCDASLVTPEMLSKIDPILKNCGAALNQKQMEILRLKSLIYAFTLHSYEHGMETK